MLIFVKFFVQVIMITTPTIMYLGYAMHKIARMDDSEYRTIKSQKKRMPIVSRGAVRDYEEAEDNGEEDPMIAEEIEQEKPDKAEKGSDKPTFLKVLLSLLVTTSDSNQCVSVFRLREEA